MKRRCGPGSVDFFGQDDRRPYEDRQRIPGDFDAQTSQRPIAIHALEHMTATDKGVLMLRKLQRGEIRKVAKGEDPKISTLRSQGTVPTYCHDTVVSIPPVPGEDDDALLARVGGRITDINLAGDHQSAGDRQEQIRRLIEQFVRSETMIAAD